MKTVTNLQKNKVIFYVILFIFFPLFSHAQKVDSLNSSPTPANLYMDCSRTLGPGCNLIENNTFTTLCYGINPFNGCVDKWDVCMGSPQINGFVPPLSPSHNGASMWAAPNTGTYNQSLGEGIATGLPNLIVGHTYNFSIYKLALPQFSNPVSRSLEEFNVVLMTCADYQQMIFSNGTAHNTPNVPATAQVIYCEKNVSNPNYQRISIQFTPKSNYNVLWIFPKQWTAGSDQWWLGVADPQLIDITNMGFGPPPNPTPGDCIVTLGPWSPQCGPAGATFTWYGPHGQVIPAPPNQQILVDAADPNNHGGWTIRMNIPNVVATNNNCSSNKPPGATTIVPPCATPPVEGLWTWMDGDDTWDVYGVYGAQGTTASTNKPGSRTYANSWKDASGNFWMFGGIGYAASTMGTLNDVWKYNPNTGDWTWIKGDNSSYQVGNYGTKTVSSPFNKPGTRAGAASWKDAAGNFWMFGGAGYDAVGPNNLNDVWKYNVTSNEWTWMAGEDHPTAASGYGVYGSQGMPSATNRPGVRWQAATSIDNSGKMWMFGGNGCSQINIGGLSDLWKFDPVTNEWTWEKGDNIADQPSNYGTMGVASATNKPGARYDAVSWTDAAGNFWLFGGLTWSWWGGPLYELNDLWKFDPITKMWTWMNGSTAINDIGVYGTQGIPSPINKPGGRHMAVGVVGASGNFWLFGGLGASNGTSSGVGLYNDLWQYDIASNQWTWVSGDNASNQFGIYGTQGTPTPYTKPGSRKKGVGWADNSGNLWFFGGNGYAGVNNGDYLNDVWRYASCPGPFCRPVNSKSTENVSGKNLSNQNADLNYQMQLAELQLKKTIDNFNVKSIEIFNATGQLVKRSNSANEISGILKNNREAGLLPGMYYIRIVYNDMSFKTIKKIFQ